MLVVASFSALFLVSESSSPAIGARQSFREPPAQSSTRDTVASEIVVVIAWDGVRWQEILKGVDSHLGKNVDRRQITHNTPEAVAPNLHAIAKRGGVLFGSDDARISASSPSTVSLPGYSEIFSGRTPACASNDCGPTKHETLLDAWHAARPSARLAVVSSWSRIPYAAAKNTAPLDISAGRSLVANKAGFCATPELCEELENGKRIAAWPGDGDYRPDHATARVALAYLRANKPHFAFIGLGDTDEHAHHGDYPRYLNALHNADETLGAVYQWLQEQERNGTRTLLIVTTDHGRGSGFSQHTNCPEAARVWALIAGSGVTERERPRALGHRLADIAPTIREFVGLSRDTAATSGSSLFDFQRAPYRLTDSAVAAH
jgi:hypothetical protein